MIDCVKFLKLDALSNKLVDYECDTGLSLLFWCSLEMTRFKMDESLLPIFNTKGI